jgi:hypothetical protein
MTEPQWPTARAVFTQMSQPQPNVSEGMDAAIELCKAAFAEWRDNLLVELLRPALTEVKHARLADEIRGAATKAPVQEQCPAVSPLPIPELHRAERCVLKAGHQWSHMVQLRSTEYTWGDGPVNLVVPYPDGNIVVPMGEPVHDDDPDADELPLIKCGAVNKNDAGYVCFLGIGHKGSHHGQINGFGRFWDAAPAPLDTQCPVQAERPEGTFRCQRPQEHEGQHDGTSGLYRLHWDDPAPLDEARRLSQEVVNEFKP